MFALTRAGFAVAIAAALFAVAPFSAKAADKPFVDSDLADSAVQLEGQIKSDAGSRHQAGGANPQGRRRRFRQERFPHRHDAARPDRRRAAQRRHHLAAHGAHRHADPPGQRPGARDLARARLDRGLHRLSAHHQPQRGGRQPRVSRRRHEPAAVVAAGARRAAVFARHPRGRQCARPIRAAARPVRFPRARLYRRCRYGLAARLLPVFGRFAGAYRFLAVRRARRHRQAGDLDGRKTALRRRFEARRQLHRDAARRPAVGGARDRCRNRPTSSSTCATASRRCGSRPPPMCCRAPDSAAFR